MLSLRECTTETCQDFKKGHIHCGVQLLMMNRDVGRAVAQMLKQEEPVTSAELKEMIVRHVVSSANDRRLAPVTGCLFDAYLNLVPKPQTVNAYEADILMRKFYMEARPLDAWEWPLSIPRGLAAYPRDLIIEIAAAIGLAHSDTLIDDSN